MFFVFFKQKTAYERRISDWSSDVCSSDLGMGGHSGGGDAAATVIHRLAALSSSGQSIGIPCITKALHEANAAIFEGGRTAGRVSGSTVEIGRASCRERVCQYVSISVCDCSFKKNYRKLQHTINRQN